MGAVTVFVGGMFGGIAALISLIGFGAEWGEALNSYLVAGTVSIAALFMLRSTMSHMPASDDQMTGWKAGSRAL